MQLGGVQMPLIGGPDLFATATTILSNSTVVDYNRQRPDFFLPSVIVFATLAYLLAVRVAALVYFVQHRAHNRKK